MEFLSQSVAGKSQECMAAVEDGELTSGSIRQRCTVHRQVALCSLCRLRLCTHVTKSTAVGRQELVPYNVTAMCGYHA